jgi:hypothetical protein
MGNSRVLSHVFETTGLSTDCSDRISEIVESWHRCSDRVAAEIG